MSSKGDNEQFTIENVQRNYPSITVEDRSSSLKSNTVSSTTPTTSPSILTRTSNQPSIASTIDDRMPESTHAQMKQPPEKKSKLPPYINASVQASARTNVKEVATIPPRKKPEQFSPESSVPSGNPRKKPEQFSPSESSVHSGNPRKKPEQFSPSESSVQFANRKSACNPNLTVTQISNSSSDKTLSSYLLARGDSSNLDTTDYQGPLKKSIQANTITLLNLTNPNPCNQRILNSPRSIGSSPTPKPADNTKVTTNSEIFKPIPKSVSLHQTMKSSDRNVLSKPSCQLRNQGVCKPNVAVINSSAMPKTPLSKPSITDVPMIVTSKHQSPSGNAKSPSETNPKQTIVQASSARALKTTTAFSVANVCPASTTSQESIRTSIKSDPSTNITLLLTNLTESRESKELLEAINSGSNVKVTQSVTLCKPHLVLPVVVPQPISNQKSKVGPLSEITQKVNVNNSTPIFKQLRKNGNVTCDVSEEAILSSSSSDVGRHDNSSYLISSDETEINEETNSPKLNQQEEPECLTISSDDEIEEPESEKNGMSFSLVNKRNEKLSIAVDESLEMENESPLDVISGEGYVALTCRSIRFGSFKKTIRLTVVLSKHGLRSIIVIPGSENVVLKIPFQEIDKVLIRFGGTIPVICCYITTDTCLRIKRTLKFHFPEENIHFDYPGDVPARTRITFIPENITDTNTEIIREIFKDTDKMMELTHQQANDILKQSAPKEVHVHRNMKQVPDEVQTIMVFPAPPAKGGISINTEDYSCLAPDVFLNDVIIDFYLKFIYLHRLSPEEREKTHIFSSFFYKRLTDKATPMPRHLKTGNSVVSPAEIRHSRVKNWTKNIDIFSKDYIIIPLNENQHWFLAIICFPGLKGPVRYADNTPIEVSQKHKTAINTVEETSVIADLDQPSSSIGSVTITPIKIELKEKMRMPVDDDNDLEDRDEAEATDEEVASEEQDTDEELLYEETEEKPKQRQKPEREPIKQPCILIFDSLRGACRNRIIATLRDYLRIEYKVKHEEDRDFSKNIVKGAIPHVPQQDNFTDCGLFVLQYVESFFENKITDYHLPIKTLRDWFPSDEVNGKRYDIMKLLQELMKAQDINIKLPDLNMHRSDDDDDEEEFYDSDDYNSDNTEDYDYVTLSPDRYLEYRDDVDYYDEEDEEDEEGEENPVLVSRRYDMYNSDEENPEDMDSDEDMSGEDIYKDLDNVEGEQIRKYRSNSYRSGDCMNEDEEMNSEEEVDNERKEGEQQLSSDIEEKLSSLDRKSISVTSINNKLPSPVGSGSANTLTGTLISVMKETDQAKLKAARSRATREQSIDECSIAKKFKPN